MEFNKSTSFYLSLAGMDPGWIVGKIAEDFKREIESLGYTCNFGAPKDYNNEDVCYHMGWAYAKPEKNAKYNSIFITHIDDKFKENLLVSLRDKFDSFICMSSEDQCFLYELGFDKSKVFGLNLPVRNDYVRPLSFGIFSAFYLDGRKNDSWLIKYFKNNENYSLVNFVFIGPNWNFFIEGLSDFDCSFEWHSTSRLLPYEYKFQQDKLSKLDYYFYLGMDGGAMGTYDAFSYGVPLLISDNSFHKDIPNVEYTFATYLEFEVHLNSIINKYKSRLEFIVSNSPKLYVEKVLGFWQNKVDNNYVNKEYMTYEVKRMRQDNYFPFSIRRALGAIKRYISKFI